jgi:hypothetical protein
VVLGSGSEPAEELGVGTFADARSAIKRLANGFEVPGNGEHYDYDIGTVPLGATQAEQTQAEETFVGWSTAVLVRQNASRGIAA